MCLCVCARVHVRRGQPTSILVKVFHLLWDNKEDKSGCAWEWAVALSELRASRKRNRQDKGRPWGRSLLPLLIKKLQEGQGKWTGASKEWMQRNHWVCAVFGYQTDHVKCLEKNHCNSFDFYYERKWNAIGRIWTETARYNLYFTRNPLVVVWKIIWRRQGHQLRDEI